jgi:hypothetical protein
MNFASVVEIPLNAIFTEVSSNYLRSGGVSVMHSGVYDDARIVGCYTV